MSRNSSSFHGSAAPPPLRVTFGHGASEVQVDVVGVVLLDEHAHGAFDSRGVDAVQLDRARGLGLVVA